MSKKELLEALAVCAGGYPEESHGEADAALLQYINDSEIEEAYGRIKKWYS